MGSEKAVDGKTETRFVTMSSIVPQWWMVDFEATKPVVKIVVVPRQGQYLVRLSKIIITIGRLFVVLVKK